MIEDYTIVAGSTIQSITAQVRRHLMDGWEPLGGVSMNGPMHIQALVKKKAPTKVRRSRGETQKAIPVTVRKK